MGNETASKRTIPKASLPSTVLRLITANTAATAIIENQTKPKNVKQGIALR